MALTDEENAANGGDGQEDSKEDPRPASQRSGAEGGQGDTARKQNLQKVLSHKAIQIGSESGVTAEFIVKQTGEQLVHKLDDLFLMFDTF